MVDPGGLTGALSAVGSLALHTDRGSMNKQIWMATAAAGALLMLSSCGETVEDSGAEDAAESTPTENVSVSAERLHSVYENNKLDAEQKFSNKNVTVIGLFSDIRKIGDQTFLRLASLEQSYDGRPQVSALKGVDIVVSDDDFSAVAGADSGDLAQVTCSKWGDSPSPWALLEACRDFKVLEKSGYAAATKYLEFIQVESPVNDGGE